MKVKKILPNNGTRMNQMVTGDFTSEEVYENIKNVSLELQADNSELKKAFIEVGINPVDGTIPTETGIDIYNLAGPVFAKHSKLISNNFTNDKAQYNVFDGANLNVFRNTMVEHFRCIASNALLETVNAANMEFTSGVKINVPEAVPTLDFLYANYYYRDTENPNTVYTPFSTLNFFGARNYYDESISGLPDLSDYYMYNICDEETMLISIIPRLEYTFNMFKQKLADGMNDYRDNLTDEQRAAMYNKIIARYNACQCNLIIRLECVIEYLYEEADRIAMAGLPGVRGIDHNKLIASLNDTTTTEEIIDRDGNIISGHKE